LSDSPSSSSSSSGSSDDEKKYEYKRIQFSFPLLLIRTTRGLKLLDKIGSWKITPKIGWFMLYILPIIAGGMFVLIAFELSATLFNAEFRTTAQSIGPQANLLIPGLNPYLPILYGWPALVIAIVVHEGSHGALARSFGLPVRSSGLVLLLAVIPVGAFVEVDDKDLNASQANKSLRVLAGGPGSNTIIAAIALIGLLIIIGTLIPMTHGALVTSVLKNTPADTIGLKPGDIITSVNGTKLTNNDNVSFYFPCPKPGNILTLQYLDTNGISHTATVMLVSSPDPNCPNNQKGIVGYTASGLDTTLNNYRSFSTRTLLRYFAIPTLPGAIQFSIPYSPTLSPYYTSPEFGTYYSTYANLLFWIWFVNFNLALFNALPIYPFDGGQAFRIFIKRLFGSKVSEITLKSISNFVSAILGVLIIAVIVLPYLIP
jgi:membrane-associated protease RseP (regulator of RpoE activity)